MSEIESAVYCQWLNGRIGEESRMLDANSLGTRSKRALSRCFNRTLSGIAASDLAEDPFEIGARPLIDSENCGETTLCEIEEWVRRCGFCLHPAHKGWRP